MFQLIEKQKQKQNKNYRFSWSYDDANRWNVLKKNVTGMIDRSKHGRHDRAYKTYWYIHTYRVHVTRFIISQPRYSLLDDDVFSRRHRERHFRLL